MQWVAFLSPVLRNTQSRAIHSIFRTNLGHRRGHPILHHICTAIAFCKSRGGSLYGECIHHSSGLASRADS